MPTYQYQCTDCGEALEVHQSFTDDALTECPACEGRLRKVFNAVGVVFKGSGFYRTDSRGTGSKEGGSSSKDSSTKDSGTKDSGSSSSGGSKSSDTSGSSSSASTKDSSSGSSSTKGSGSAA